MRQCSDSGASGASQTWNMRGRPMIVVSDPR